MVIQSAKYVASYPSVDLCKASNNPEFAFVGRSNVGKSSLINMLTGTKKLAKISQTPGKTRTINFFEINGSWNLVDLPGYGYAKVSKSIRKQFSSMVLDYIEKRSNLYLLFVLVDSRHEPQKIDLEFVNWLGTNNVPFALIFTKSDKIPTKQLEENINRFKEVMLESWEELPRVFSTSAVRGAGRDDVLQYIDAIIAS